LRRRSAMSCSSKVQSSFGELVRSCIMEKTATVQVVVSCAKELLYEQNHEVRKCGVSR
jgi:hypothetical protein